jgi:hypothetical protein
MLFSTITNKAPANVIARVNHKTKELQINPLRFSKLNSREKQLVLAHEAAHLITGSRDENLINKAAQNAVWSNFDPITLTTIIATAASVGTSLDWNSLFNGSGFNQGWHGLSDYEKRTTAQKMLNDAFKIAIYNGIIPFEVFWQGMTPNIFRSNEKEFGQWIAKNPWFRDQMIPEAEAIYGFDFYKKPSAIKSLMFQAKVFFTNPLNLTIIGLTIGLAVFYFVQKKKKK